MPEVQLNIPAIGEGLQEARVVALLKQPGDLIARDEAIYQMETDKAVMDVESSVSGRVVRWLASADDVLAIGAPILVVDTADEVPAEAGVPAEVIPLLPVAAVGGIVELNIPAIGEGLQEARLVATLKNPGDKVKRDEAIYQMETDKAVMDVESPYEGEVVEWLAQVDDVLAIGAPILRFKTDEAVAGAAPVAPVSSGSSSAVSVAATPVDAGGRRRDVPPRTRAYAKEKGVSAERLEVIPARGAKLMPGDIDAFLAGGAVAPVSAPGGSKRGKNFSEEPFGGKQKILASRLQRGNQLVVPGMMSIVVDWGKIEELRDMQKAKGGDFQPSSFTYFAYAVAKAAAAHPIMRSTLVGDSAVRTYDHLQLGIAVSLPGDELVVAVVRDSDILKWVDFANEMRARINDARGGKDQADESVTLSITNMAGHGIREAMAVVVPPGVATVFLGEAYNGLSNEVAGEFKVMRCANVGITIDHRLINGVGGAEFLNAVRDNVARIAELTA